ncbi:MAG: hypothetical protein ABSG98_11890 [Anaerolineales bacterium]|jgi:hypothetical protein
MDTTEKPFLRVKAAQETVLAGTARRVLTRGQSLRVVFQGELLRGNTL